MNLRPVRPILAATLFAMGVSMTYAADATQRKSRAKEPRPEEDRSKVSPARPADKVVVFKKTLQGELKAHIYFPPGWSAADRRPAIVFWSGGAFRNGAVGQFLSKAEYFASRGLVTICAEYRGRGSRTKFSSTVAWRTRAVRCVG